MLQSIRDDAQCKRLHLGHGIFASCAIAHRSGQLGDLGDPPAICLLLKLNCELHRHRRRNHTTENRQPYALIASPYTELNASPIAS